MNPSAIYSKTGKGVQEAGGRTSHLGRADRAVLAAFDGRTPAGEVAKKFEKIAPDKFEQLVTQLERDGFIREVASSASGASPAGPQRQPAAAPPAGAVEDELDFTQILKAPPRAPGPPRPTADLAAAARAEAERQAKEKEMSDFRARKAAEARAKAEEAARAKAAAEARARAEAEAKARALAEANAKAEAEAKIRAAREAAARLAAEARARVEAEAKAKAEAEERARREAEEKARLEAELTAKLEAERRAREEAERRAAEAAERARREAEERARREAEERAWREAEERARREAEEKARREAEELRQRLEEERRAREEAERKEREEAARRARGEEERRRREEEERRAREEAERRAREEERRAREEAEHRAREEERRAREEAERKAAEAAERARREAEEKARREAEELRQRLEEERRAREEAERRAREEQERHRREEEERRAREEAERRAREEAERRAREEEEQQRQAEARSRREDEERRARIEDEQRAERVEAPKPAATAQDLLADLDAFAQREEEERRAREEAERKAKEEAARRAREEEERGRREEEERRVREEAERMAREEAERRAREEEESRRREEEARLAREQAERSRRARETLAAKAAARPAAALAGEQDVPISDEDLDLDEVRRDQKALSQEARRAAREREEAAIEKARAPRAAEPRRPKKWGKRLALGAFALAVVAVGVAHVIPLSTAEYESAASEALGVPVTIGAARLSLITGAGINFERVRIGEASAATVRARPALGSVFGARKTFDAVELEGVSAPQGAFGAALFGKAAGSNFSLARVSAKQVKLDGPLALPPLDIEAVFAADGAPQTVAVRGADKLTVRISPRGAEAAVEISAASFALPFVPALGLSDFSLKGAATRAGLTVSEFEGRAFDGTIAGNARVRWGATWAVEGELRVRGVNAAVFAPALLSEGRAEGRGVFQMSGTVPARLHENARLEGSFKVDKGALGFDIGRALAGGRPAGRTEFAELSAQGVYERGAVQLRNIAFARGALSASGALDIAPDGALAGRLTAEVRTPAQSLRGTVGLSGKAREPVIGK